MLYLLAIAATSPHLFVTTASSSPELAAGLVEELGKNALVERAEDAELIVSLAEVGGSLELVVRIAGGAAVVQRSISLEDGRAPALRVAVLLVRAAVEEHKARQREVARTEVAVDRREGTRTEVAEDEPGQPRTSTVTPPLRTSERASEPALEPAIEPARPEDSLSLHVSPLFGLSTWSRPFLPPQLTFGVSAAIATRWYAFGATLLASGQLCCDRSSDAITATAREVLIAAGAAFTPIDTGALKLGVHLAPGINLLSGEAAVREPIFARPGTPKSYSTRQAIALAEVSASIALSDRFALLFRAGAKAALSGRRPISAPEPLAMGAKPLDSGAITPFLLAGLSVKIF